MVSIVDNEIFSNIGMYSPIFKAMHYLWSSVIEEREKKKNLLFEVLCRREFNILFLWCVLKKLCQGQQFALKQDISLCKEI